MVNRRVREGIGAAKVDEGVEVIALTFNRPFRHREVRGAQSPTDLGGGGCWPDGLGLLCPLLDDFTKLGSLLAVFTCRQLLRGLSFTERSFLTRFEPGFSALALEAAFAATAAAETKTAGEGVGAAGFPTGKDCSPVPGGG